MFFRVPLLLQKAVAVIYQLDITATRAIDPVGELTSGYNETLEEPIVYDTSVAATDTRISTRTEKSVIYVPCQVEILQDEALRALALGDAPITNISFVFHRKDLERLSLLDSNRNVILKKGDRVDSLERFGAPIGTKVKTFASPGLYIYEMRSKSWGFGPDGYDLEVALTTKRREAAT